MADINIENFYRHIAKILSILYEAFPSKASVFVDDVADIDTPNEYGLHSPQYTAGFFALVWLGDEEFLRYTGTIRQDGIDQACLTHKGFLNSHPLLTLSTRHPPIVLKNPMSLALRRQKI